MQHPAVPQIWNGNYRCADQPWRAFIRSIPKMKPSRPRTQQNNQEPQGPAKTVSPKCRPKNCWPQIAYKTGSFKTHAMGQYQARIKAGHCPATLPQPNRKRHVRHRVLHRPLKLLPAPATVVQKTADCRQPYGLVKKLMMSRRLDAKHGAFYLLQHTRIGQPPQ